MPDALEQGQARLSDALSRDRRRLVRFVRSRLSPASELDAEDVVSDVVVRLFERADLLAQVDDVAAYLFGALANRLADLFRRRRPLEEISPDHADPAATPEQAAGQAQLRCRLDAALDRLSPAERAVWVAVEVEGETFRDLAERWGEPIGTLLSRKNRAGKALKKWLAAEHRDLTETQSE